MCLSSSCPSHAHACAVCVLAGLGGLAKAIRHSMDEQAHIDYLEEERGLRGSYLVMVPSRGPHSFMASGPPCMHLSMCVGVGTVSLASSHDCTHEACL